MKPHIKLKSRILVQVEVIRCLEAQVHKFLGFLRPVRFDIAGMMFHEHGTCICPGQCDIQRLYGRIGHGKISVSVGGAEHPFLFCHSSVIP